MLIGCGAGALLERRRGRLRKERRHVCVAGQVKRVCARDLIASACISEGARIEKCVLKKVEVCVCRMCVTPSRSA